MAKIIVTIKGHDTKIAVDGVKGESCTELTASVQKALGLHVNTEETTPEFFEEPEASTEQEKANEADVSNTW